MDQFDVVVIGSGPAGYRAAMQAGKNEEDGRDDREMTPNRLGGAWIHTGTIPSKTLRESMPRIRSTASGRNTQSGSKWVDRIHYQRSAGIIEKLMGQALKVAQYEEAIVRRYCDRYKITILRRPRFH